MKRELLVIIVVLLVAIFGVSLDKKLNQPASVPPPPPPIVFPIQPPPPPVPVKPLETVQWIEFQPLRSSYAAGDFFSDVMNHSTGSRNYGDRDTTAHETTHAINSYIRNKYGNGKRVNGFYVGNNKAVIIDEPNFKISQVIPFIPQKLRGNRFDLYLVRQQRDWNDSPLYIFDEWVSYVNGSTVSVEDAMKSPPKGNGRTNAVYSCAEFFVYATAVAMAAERHDPQYFAANKQFRSFLVWHLRRSMRTYKMGMKFECFRWDESYFQTLKTGPEAQQMREFLEKKLGFDLKELFDV